MRVINITDEAIETMYDSKTIVFAPGVEVDLEAGLDLHFEEKFPGKIVAVVDAPVEPVFVPATPEVILEPAPEVISTPEVEPVKAKK